MKVETLEELIDKVAEHKLLGQLEQQVQKDFKRANIQLQAEVSTTAQQLLVLVKEKVYVLLLEQFDTYLNLLYVVDVPEKSFKQISSTDVVEASNEVAFLILKREFQKVWYRSKFA